VQLFVDVDNVTCQYSVSVNNIGDNMINLRMFLSVIVIELILLGTVSATDVYKWVDENGAIHFQASPPQNTQQPVIIKRLPTYEDNYQNSKRIESGENRGNVDSNDQATTRETSREAEVELYVTSWCPYCKKASDFFRSRGIPFTAYDIEKDKSAARRKKRLTKETGVPFAIINGKAIQGFKRAAYERALRGG
jgi:glutaredoxin